MRKIQKLQLFGVIFALGFSLIVAVPLLAVSDNIPVDPTKSQPIDNRSQEIRFTPVEVLNLNDEQKQKREEIEGRISKNCQKNQERVLSVKSRSEQYQAKHQEIYTRWSEKITALVVRLEEAGADTTQLKTDIATLNSMVIEKNGEFVGYQEKLNFLGTAGNCQEQPSGFYEALQASRESRKRVVSSLQEIRAFIQDTIKKDLQDIREQLTNQVKEDV